MVGILLLILKIIGIVILCVLGLLLALLLIILFAPVHYKVKAEYYGNPIVDVRVSWLAKLLRGKVHFEDQELIGQVKALWFSLYDLAGKDEEERSKPKKTKKLKKEKNVFEDEKEAESVNESLSESELHAMEEVQSLDAEEQLQQGVSVMESLEAENVSKEEFRDEAVLEEEFLNEEVPEEEVLTEKQSVFQKIKMGILNLIDKIRTLIQGAISFVRGLLVKTEERKAALTEKIQQFTQMWNDPENRALIAFLKKQLGKLIRIIKPKKYDVYAHFGFEDPETTGKLAMYLAVAYGFLGMNLSVHPDFDEEVLEGHIHFQGYIQLYGLIIIAIQCYTNQQIRKFINK